MGTKTLKERMAESSAEAVRNYRKTMADAERCDLVDVIRDVWFQGQIHASFMTQLSESYNDASISKKFSDDHLNLINEAGKKMLDEVVTILINKCSCSTIPVKK